MTVECTAGIKYDSSDDKRKVAIMAVEDVWSEALQFHYEHGGYCYDPATERPEDGRARCALAAAGAEAWAKEQGIEFRWEDDWQVTDHAHEFCADAYPDGNPETCEQCSAWLGGECLAAIGCVDDADDNYRRVIEAELAMEARAELTRLMVAAL